MNEDRDWTSKNTHKKTEVVTKQQAPLFTVEGAYEGVIEARQLVVLLSQTLLSKWKLETIFEFLSFAKTVNIHVFKEMQIHPSVYFISLL